jgi:hypothetical protein
MTSASADRQGRWQEREVDGGRLADATLAAGDRDDVLDAGQRQRAARLGLGLSVSMAVRMTMRLGPAGPVGAARSRLQFEARRGGRSAPRWRSALLAGPMISRRPCGPASSPSPGRVDLDRNPTWPSRRVRPLHAGAREVAALRQPDGAKGIRIWVSVMAMPKHLGGGRYAIDGSVRTADGASSGRSRGFTHVASGAPLSYKARVGFTITVAGLRFWRAEVPAATNIPSGIV